MFTNNTSRKTWEIIIIIEFVRVDYYSYYGISARESCDTIHSMLPREITLSEVSVIERIDGTNFIQHHITKYYSTLSHRVTKYK